MSKVLRLAAVLWLPCVAMLFSVSATRAQDITARISFDTAGSTKIKVSGRFSDEIAARVKNLSFLDGYGSAVDLGKRISLVTLSDATGNDVAYKRFAPGEYVAASAFRAWQYTIDVRQPAAVSAAAHVSWVRDDFGLIYLEDLLPQIANGGRDVSARIEFELPAGWQIHSAAERTNDATFETADEGAAVFYLERSGMPDGSGTIVHGTFNFTNTDVETIAGELFEYYSRSFGPLRDPRYRVTFIRAPPDVPAGAWEADTRGRSVTVISSDMPFKTQSLQRLHEQLRHEMFHLWIPNAVELSGNYDWFYEGFALYSSLKAGALNGRIRFEDFLDTLSRAYHIDSTLPAGISLIGASKQRWAGGNTRVYARGLLVAFLCDLRLLEASRGRESVDDILRGLYLKHRKPAPKHDGNDAVIHILALRPPLEQLATRYITGSEKLSWAAELDAAGLQFNGPGPLSKLEISKRPNGKQKKILDRLGYNSWRNIHRPSK